MLISSVFAPKKGGTEAEAQSEGQGILLGFVASRAHHSDVGGMSPGSMPLAQEIFQEGLRIPPVRRTLRPRRGRKRDSPRNG